MVELGIMLGMGAIAIALGSLLSRWLLKRDGLRSGPALLGATRAGSNAFLRLHLRAFGVLALLVAFLIFIAYGVVRAHQTADPASSSYALAAWITLSFLLGAASATASVHVATWVCLRAAPRILSASRASPSQILVTALRSASVAPLLSAGAQLLGLVLLCSTAYGFSGGFQAVPPQATAASHMALLVVGYAFGATFGSLVAHLLGGLLVASSSVGTSENISGATTVARLVGLSLRHATGWSTDLFSTTAATAVLTLVLTASLCASNAERISTHLGVVLFPFLALTFGLLACMVGVSVVRTDGSENPVAALDRGLYVTVLLTGASLFGLCRWLFATHWRWLFVASVLGVFLALVVVILARYHAVARVRPISSGPLSLLLGLSTGMNRSVLFVGLSAIALLGGYHAGRATTLVHGGAIGIALTAIGMLAPAPYILATAGLGGIIRTVNAFARVSASPPSTHTDRFGPLTHAGTIAIAQTRAYASVSTGLLALVAVASFFQVARAYGEPASWQVFSHAPALLGGTVVGPLVVVGTSGMVLRGLASVLGVVETELRREGKSGAEGAGSDGDGNQQRCFGLLLQEALRRGVQATLVVLAIPLMVGVSARVLAAWGGAPSSTAMVVAFLTTVSVGSVFLALGCDGALDSWRFSWTSEGVGTTAVDETSKTSNYSGAVAADALGGSFRGTLEPSLHALVKLLATATVTLAPLLY